MNWRPDSDGWLAGDYARPYKYGGKGVDVTLTVCLNTCNVFWVENGGGNPSTPYDSAQDDGWCHQKKRDQCLAFGEIVQGWNGIQASGLASTSTSTGAFFLVEAS